MTGFPQRLIQVLGLGLAILAPLHAADAQDLEKVEIQTVPVAQGIYMLVGEGGNIGVSVGEDGAFLIDDQFAPLTEKIQAAVSALDERPIRFILNTHWHFDTTWGNGFLKPEQFLRIVYEDVSKSSNR